MDKEQHRASRKSQREKTPENPLSNGSRIAGSSFSGLFTRVDIGHVRNRVNHFLQLYVRARRAVISNAVFVLCLTGEIGPGRGCSALAAPTVPALTADRAAMLPGRRWPPAPPDPPLWWPAHALSAGFNRRNGLAHRRRIPLLRIAIVTIRV